MNTTETSTARFRCIATVLALGTAALSLSACGSSDSGPTLTSPATSQTEASPSATETAESTRVYQTFDDGTPVFLQTAGQDVLLTTDELAADEVQTVIDAAAEAELDPEADYVEKTGTLEASNGDIQWDDGELARLGFIREDAMLDDQLMTPFDEQKIEELLSQDETVPTESTEPSAG